jgi:hypothetical protein
MRNRPPENVMTFRTINGQPIRWRDLSDIVHACQGTYVPDGSTLLWTLCQMDVPAEAAFAPQRPRDDVSCAICERHLKEGQSPHFSAIDPKGSGPLEGEASPTQQNPSTKHGTAPYKA